jgi:hypothetical protein
MPVSVCMSCVCRAPQAVSGLLSGMHYSCCSLQHAFNTAFGPRCDETGQRLLAALAALPSQLVASVPGAVTHNLAHSDQPSLYPRPIA